MKQIEMANILGIGQNAYSMIEGGKTGLSLRNRTTLERQLQINPDYLNHGHEPMFLPVDTQITATNTITASPHATINANIHNQQDGPKASNSSQCKQPDTDKGAPFLGQTPNEKNIPLWQLALNHAEYYINIKPLNSCHFYRQVSAQNMSPHYNPGDIIACRLIENIQDTILYGHSFLFVVSTANGRYETMAKLRKSDNMGQVLFESINTSFDTYEISISDIAEAYLICGRIERTL